MACVGCTQEMANQPRYDPLEYSTYFPDGLSARPVPAGTVSREFRQPDEMADLGALNGKPADRFPFPITMELLLRGQERYNIFCTPCHDYVGTGDGMAARRGFRRKPASFHSEELRSAPPGHFFDVITNGFGSMPDCADPISPPDRWAVIAYIRALQLSQWASLEVVPAEERGRLQAEGAQK